MMKHLITMLVGGAFLTGLALLEGLVLSVLWRWFLVPLGLPAIGIAHAVGIAALMGMFHQTSTKKEESGPTILARAVLNPLIFLGIGALAHWAM